MKAERVANERAWKRDR